MNIEVVTESTTVKSENYYIFSDIDGMICLESKRDNQRIVFHPSDADEIIGALTIFKKYENRTVIEEFL